MVTVLLVCVGKLKEKWLAEASKEYEKRLSAFCRLQIVELPEERLPDKPAPAQIQNALKKEGERVKAVIPSGAFTSPALPGCGYP